jgi:hypothetical protein
MTKSEAEAKVASLNNTPPSWYCPIAQTTCRKECYCYSKASLRATITSQSRQHIEYKYEVIPPTCTNKLMES